MLEVFVKARSWNCEAETCERSAAGPHRVVTRAWQFILLRDGERNACLAEQEAPQERQLRRFAHGVECCSSSLAKESVCTQPIGPAYRRALLVYREVPQASGLPSTVGAGDVSGSCLPREASPSQEGCRQRMQAAAFSEHARNFSDVAWLMCTPDQNDALHPGHALCAQPSFTNVFTRQACTPMRQPPPRRASGTPRMQRSSAAPPPRARPDHERSTVSRSPLSLGQAM